MNVSFDDVLIPTTRGDVAALVHVPARARWLYVLAHGAGAGMRHSFMSAVAQRLAARDIATLRYEYPYITAGRKRPDAAPHNEAVTRDVCTFAARQYGGLRLTAGGKSMGGRMTSQAQASEPLARVESIIFLGFPLHGMGQPPNVARAEHLSRINVPLLFLQGTRDNLADLTLMRSVCEALGDRATLHVIEGGDHSFSVPRSSGKSSADTYEEICDVIAGFLKSG